MMKSQFVGAMGERAFIVQALRAAFRGDEFDITAIHGLQRFEYETFAKWVRALHCKPYESQEQKRMAQFYCVNYFLCPEGDEFDVEALFREIWPQESSVVKKPKWRLKFRWDS